MRLNDATLPAYLVEVGVLESPDSVETEVPGDGNINYVRRARHPAGASVIVKQARPTLERFPEYRVSTERIVFERRYLETVEQIAPAVAPLLPRVIYFDRERRVLVMEDLGEAPTLEAKLLAGTAPEAPLAAIGGFLGCVHAASIARSGELGSGFRNCEMQALHGEHIFTLPYQANDFPIPAELARFSARALEESGGRARIAELRGAYYETREALVHGDLQGGNVLLQGETPRLLDAEIAHVGDPAFDLGIALAHLRLHRHRTDPSRPTLSELSKGERALLDGYLAAGGPRRNLDRADRYCGVEMLRRSIGAARPEFVKHPEVARRTFSAGLEWLTS